MICLNSIGPHLSRELVTGGDFVPTSAALPAFSGRIAWGMHNGRGDPMTSWPSADEGGLSEQRASELLRTHGPNELPQARRRSVPPKRPSGPLARPPGGRPCGTLTGTRQTTGTPPANRRHRAQPNRPPGGFSGLRPLRQRFRAAPLAAASAALPRRPSCARSTKPHRSSRLTSAFSACGTAR